MSNVCCKEFGGWFKSFTKIERVLAVLEAILLVLFIVLLVLLILHLIFCSKPDKAGDIQPTTTVTDEKHKTTNAFEIVTNGSEGNASATTSAEGTSSGGSTSSSAANKPSVKCSWTPSAKTTPAVHYYEDANYSKTYTKPAISHKPNYTSHDVDDTTVLAENVTSEIGVLVTDATSTQVSDDMEDFFQLDYSDGEEPEDIHKSQVAGLVKLKPPKDVTFGCILTIVTEFWTLTAASCIEAIEETDSLDSFVIMKDYGSNKREPLQLVEDVQIHPLYEGKNRSYDLAALKSAGSLTKGPPMELASLLDYALLSLGERLTVLGFGAFRSIDTSTAGRRLRRAHVFLVSARACAEGAGEGAAGGALRHLVSGGAAAAARGARGAAALCAGALAARARPCTYCSGAPLVRAARLLGLMADNQLCGVACEPQLYVNLAAAAGWIRDTTARQ